VWPSEFPPMQIAFTVREFLGGIELEYSYELLEEICFGINRSFSLSVTLYSCTHRQGHVLDSSILEKTGKQLLNLYYYCCYLLHSDTGGN